MKKIISALLSLMLIVSLAISADAAECNHTYTRTKLPATCCDKACVLFACQKCDYSYKVYADEYTEPDGFHIIAKSVRTGSVLTVTVEFFKNPGIDASRLLMNYNINVLSLKEVTYGNVWEKKDYSHNTDNTSPLKVLAIPGAESSHNTKNGVFFTAIFDIKQAGSYGVSFSHGTGDFPSWDDSTNTSVKYTPKIINLVGADEYGDHTFEYSGVISESTFTEHGTSLYVCTLCKEERTEDLPLLEHWQKGDLNNDGKVNAVDTNLLIRFLVGMSASVQALDAADMDSSGNVNSMDAYQLKIKVAGN